VTVMTKIKTKTKNTVQSQEH